MNTIAVAGALAFMALGVFGAVHIGPGPATPVFLIAAIWFVVATRKSGRRRELAAAPFPLEWRDVLRSTVWFYSDLSADRKIDFERQVAVFIGETRFAGVDGIDVTDELKVLAASSAVMLLFHRPDLEYPRIAEVLFYPRPFSSETFSTRGRNRHLAGLNNDFGAVVLSVPDLRRGFSYRGGGMHVGLHEFAHALERRGDRWNNLPVGMEAADEAAWMAAYKEETEKLRQGRSILDAYALTNDVEFFAVAVETYFLQGSDLRAESPSLFEVLERYFRASPDAGMPPRKAKRRPHLN